MFHLFGMAMMRATSAEKTTSLAFERKGGLIVVALSATLLIQERDDAFEDWGATG
jgi:hypothetical protein